MENLVMTNEILNMREKLLECLTVQEKFLFAESTYLTKAFSRKLITNPFVDYSINQILAKSMSVIYQSSF
jgi:hypothetical protein